MNKEIIITRRQLRRAGANDAWFEEHMKGRGSLPLSKVVTCAPPYFKAHAFEPYFTGRVDFQSGKKIYYKEGQPHREDGPAIEYASGTKAWFIDGELHREDGPAIEYADGNVEFLLHGYIYQSQEAVNKALQKQGVFHQVLQDRKVSS